MNIRAFFLSPYAFIFYVLLFFNIFRKLYPIIRNYYIYKKKYDSSEILNREINCGYTPSTVSMLIDNELEIKDITADLMNLYANKYLIVNKSSNKYNITVNNESTKTLDNLCNSDRYLIDTIILKKEPFEFKIWKSYVEQNFNSLDFTKQLKHISLKTYAIIIIIISIVIMLLSFIITHQFSISFIFGLSTATISTIILSSFSTFHSNDKIYKLHLNAKGTKELKKWFRFKEFIKEYTLIDEKNMQDITLYEKYIPYAVALGINKNYKDTIYSVFNEFEIKKLLEDSKIDYLLYKNTNFNTSSDN